jgi:hypothetical protein
MPTNSSASPDTVFSWSRQDLDLKAPSIRPSSLRAYRQGLNISLREARRPTAGRTNASRAGDCIRRA